MWIRLFIKTSIIIIIIGKTLPPGYVLVSPSLALSAALPVSSASLPCHRPVSSSLIIVVMEGKQGRPSLPSHSYPSFLSARLNIRMDAPQLKPCRPPLSFLWPSRLVSASHLLGSLVCTRNNNIPACASHPLRSIPQCLIESNYAAQDSFS